jgi:hypothetical protein
VDGFEEAHDFSVTIGSDTDERLVCGQVMCGASGDTIIVGKQQLYGLHLYGTGACPQRRESGNRLDGPLDEAAGMPLKLLRGPVRTTRPCGPHEVPPPQRLRHRS